MFPIEPNDLPRPLGMPRPHQLADQIPVGPPWSRSDWVQTNQIQTRFKLDSNPTNVHPPTSPPSCFAVCLAACKYQHRKWCHSGDAVKNPVWTLASWWRRLETGSEMAPPSLQFALFVCLINGLSWSFFLLSITFLSLLSETRRCANVPLNDCNIWGFLKQQMRWFYWFLLQFVLLQYISSHSDGIWKQKMIQNPLKVTIRSFCRLSPGNPGNHSRKLQQRRFDF